MLIDVVFIILFVSLTIALPIFFGYISYRPHQLSLSSCCEQLRQHLRLRFTNAR